MDPSQTSIATTSSSVRLRTRVGSSVLVVLLLWLVYMLGLVPWVFDLIIGIESDLWRILTAMGVIGAVVLSLMNLRAFGALLRKPVRKVINYVTPVLALDVAAERLKQVRSRLTVIEKRIDDVAALRVGQENEVERLTREEQAVLREAADPRSKLDDATLGRRLNRSQEALALRREQLDDVRATEEMLIDAREVCDLCAARVQAAMERYRYAVEIARTILDVGSIAGATRAGDATEEAEQACLSELDEVDLLLANLDSALYDRKLGDRAAALRISEMRMQLRGRGAAASTNVRVDTADAHDQMTEQDEQPVRRGRRR